MQNDGAHGGEEAVDQRKPPLFTLASQPLHFFKTELSLRLEVTHVLSKKRNGSSELKETLETQRTATTWPSLSAQGYSEHGVDLCNSVTMKLCKVGVPRKTSYNLPYCNKPEIPYNHIFIF